MNVDVFGILRDIPDLSRVPDAQLHWLIANGVVRSFSTDEIIFKPEDPADNLVILLEGRVRIARMQTGDQREIIRLEPGEITGVLPYSRMVKATAQAQALTDVSVLFVHRSVFPAMIATHYELVEALVHVMTNRVRTFTSLQSQNEKLMALGKISAGLAHELNNPASAAVRSATELRKHLRYLPDGFKRVISIRLEEAQVDGVNDLLFSRLAAGGQRLSLMERTQREDDIRDWLEDMGLETAEDASEVFTDFGFTIQDLKTVLSYTNKQEIAPIMGWLYNVLTTEKLVFEIQEAARRIAELVQSVKSYSHMDQSQDWQLVSIPDGIRNTATMLRHKFKANRVEFRESYADNLPLVSGYPGELNQVWTNLMDNALDAMAGTGGTLTVQAQPEDDCVVVSITDTGTGIPEEVVSRIFEPFFTTKAPGQGTGLGLDIVQKIAYHHRAKLDVTSKPGETTFSLCLPIRR
jgi:signal transduction histidine kinase